MRENINKVPYKSSGEVKLPISAFIITLNEENNIKECIESVSFCDEIIVVDSGSVDRTRQIAAEHGARVIENEFKGYRDQKQFALEQCSNEWVLSIDADERVEYKLYEFISKLDLNNNPVDGYEVKRLYWFLGKWMKHSGLYPDYKLRFFRKSKGEFVGDNIHEVIEVSGTVNKINCDLLHYSWVDTKDFFIRQIKYAEKVAENKFLEGKQTSFFEVSLKLKFAFLNKFFLRFGFLDGMQGFIVSFGSAVSTAYKYLKLWELNNKFHAKSFFKQSFLTKCLLKPVQLIYGCATKLRVYFYESGILKKQKLSVPVISVGNLSVGGSGKTPFVIWLTKLLSKRNFTNVAILSRGYKAKPSNNEPQEVNLDSEPLAVGDEPLMMKQFLVTENTDVVVHPSRFVSGQYAISKLAKEILILDDGFQHMQLQRDLNICLVDCSDPYFAELFPIGSRREGLKQLERADVIVLTRSQHNKKQKQKYLNLIKKYTSEKRILELNEGITKFTRGNTPVEEYPQGKKALAFCGLGNPSQFFVELENCGVKLQKTISYPDHHKYTTKDLQFLQNQLICSESDYLITTTKDAVKICYNNKEVPNLLIAHNEIHSVLPLQEEFEEIHKESKAIEDNVHSDEFNLLGLEIIEKLTDKEAHKIG